MTSINVDKDLYKRVLRRLENSKDTISLSEDFSIDPDFFLPILNDISRGVDSPNYCLLNEFTDNDTKKTTYLSERAEFIFCSIYETLQSGFDQNLYEILDIRSDAGIDEIRKKWFEITEKYSATGNTSSIDRKNINRAFYVLIDPEKRRSYDTRLNSQRPVYIKNPECSNAGKKGHLIFPILIIFAFGFIFQHFIGFAPNWKNNKEHADSNTEIFNHENNNIAEKDLKIGEIKSNKAIRSASNSDKNSVTRSTISEKSEKNPVNKNNIKKQRDNSILIASANKFKYAEKQDSEYPNSKPEYSNTEDHSKTGKVGSGENIKPPVRIDELLIKKNKWNLEYGLSYTNIDSTSQTVEIIDLPASGGETITFPLIVNRQVDQDILISTLNLRYGLRDDLEVFGFTSMFANFLRVSTNNDNIKEKDNDFNFNSAGTGVTYRLFSESRYPALLATATVNILDNTNFGSFKNFNKEKTTGNSDDQDNMYGLDLEDDYHLNYFKTLSFSLTSYYSADPVVFFLEGKYLQNFKRENSVSIDPGEGFSLSPQVFFIASPYLTLSWGLRFSLRGADKTNGERINSLRTRLSPLFGVSYELKDNLIFSLDAEYVNDPDFNRATAGLRLNYNF